MGFFAAKNRLYSRETTAFITDLTGILVVLILALYCALAGVFFYREITEHNPFPMPKNRYTTEYVAKHSAKGAVKP